MKLPSLLLLIPLGVLALVALISLSLSGNMCAMFCSFQPAPSVILPVATSTVQGGPAVGVVAAVFGLCAAAVGLCWLFLAEGAPEALRLALLGLLCVTLVFAFVAAVIMASLTTSLLDGTGPVGTMGAAAAFAFFLFMLAGVDLLVIFVAKKRVV